MAVFRVEKDKGYTVMSNFHLNDKTITLKAKGLLSQMLSLPETWDYTLKGLACINKESVDAIRTAVLELEQQGYIVRQQGRDAGGKLAAIEYIIYERPQAPTPPLLENPITVKPSLENPIPDKPISGKPLSGNPTQLNTNQKNKKEINTDLSIIHQSIYPATLPDGMDGIEKKSAMDVYEELVKENIEYDILCERYSVERMDEVVELILETVCVKRPYFRICGQDYPAEVVKSRLLKLNSSHIEYVFDCIDRNTTKVRNIKSYMLTTLYNAPATIDHYYRAEVNHDLYGAEN